jgi:hypothetical protein
VFSGDYSFEERVTHDGRIGWLLLITFIEVVFLFALSTTAGKRTVSRLLDAATKDDLCFFGRE